MRARFVILQEELGQGIRDSGAVSHSEAAALPPEPKCLGGDSGCHSGGGTAPGESAGWGRATPTPGMIPD